MARKAKTSTANGTQPDTALVLATSPSIVATAQVNLHEDLPDLRQVQVKPLNLMMDYWTPQEAGECKTLIFMRVQPDDPIPDFNDPSQTVQRDCAYFIEQTEQGFQILRNASSRLVSMARHFLEGQIYQVTFQGLRTNKTNSNKSNFWAIQPVMLAS